MRINVASTVLAVLLTLPHTSAQAATLTLNDAVALDGEGLAQLEQRAEHAEAREQAFLYTELVTFYTQLAGKQFAAGEYEQANASLKRIELFSQHIHNGLARNAKKLKDAEMMLHLASYHLGQYMRSLSQDDQTPVKSTLRQLDKVHDELLQQVFAH
jgi:hypothetical protein